MCWQAAREWPHFEHADYLGQEVVDCDVDNLVGKKCTVDCDDACTAVPDATEVYESGGWQEIHRKIVVDPPNACGPRCVALSRTKKCNQKRCPVDRVMSEWCGWSRCTAHCEGGARSHTRSSISRPKNGGIACNTNKETETCNTMSCDRGFILAPWTRWERCFEALDDMMAALMYFGFRTGCSHDGCLLSQ